MGIGRFPHLLPLLLLEDPEDGPDGDEAVNVGGAVQRVEGHDVVAPG